MLNAPNQTLLHSAFVSRLDSACFVTNLVHTLGSLYIAFDPFLRSNSTAMYSLLSLPVALTALIGVASAIPAKRQVPSATAVAAGVAPTPVFDTDFPDPALLRVDTNWYAYATGKSDQSVHVQLATSSDYETWTLQTGHDVLPKTPAWVYTHSPRVWAPDVHMRVCFLAIPSQKSTTNTVPERRQVHPLLRRCACRAHWQRNDSRSSLHRPCHRRRPRRTFHATLRLTTSLPAQPRRRH